MVRPLFESGLYLKNIILTPYFCGLYSRAACNRERLLMARLRYVISFYKNQIQRFIIQKYDKIVFFNSNFSTLPLDLFELYTVLPFLSLFISLQKATVLGTGIVYQVRVQSFSQLLLHYINEIGSCPTSIEIVCIPRYLVDSRDFQRSRKKGEKTKSNHFSRVCFVPQNLHELGF